MIALRIASGRPGHRSMSRARSGSESTESDSDAPDSAPPAEPPRSESLDLQRLDEPARGFDSPRLHLPICSLCEGREPALRELLGQKRLRFTDDQRRRPAVKGKAVGRRLLREIASIITHDTILRWHRQLIACKYDGNGTRGSGRPLFLESMCLPRVRPRPSTS